MSGEKVVQLDLRKLLQKVSASSHLYIFLQLDEKILCFFSTSHCDVNNADRKRVPDDYQ